MLDRNVRGIGIALCLLTLFIFLTGCGSLKDDTLLTVNAVITEVDAGKQTIIVKDDADESALSSMKSFADEERKIKIDEIEPADSSTCVMHASWRLCICRLWKKWRFF